MAQGKRLVFVTNNSTKSRAGYVKKFTGLGLSVKPVRKSYFAQGSHLLPAVPLCCFLTFENGQKIARMSLITNSCLQEEIYSSSYAAAAYLEAVNFDKNKKVSSVCTCASMKHQSVTNHSLCS